MDGSLQILKHKSLPFLFNFHCCSAHCTGPTTFARFLLLHLDYPGWHKALEELANAFGRHFPWSYLIFI